MGRRKMDLLNFQMALIEDLLTIQEEPQPPPPEQEQEEQEERDGEGEQEQEEQPEQESRKRAREQEQEEQSEEEEEEHMAQQSSSSEEEIVVPGEPEFIAYVPPAPRHDPINRLGGFQQHELDALPQTGKKQYPTRNCRVCKRRDGRRRETRYYCAKCNVALCVVGCFKIFHTLRNYRN